MKKIITASLIALSLFAVSYSIAASLNAKSVVAQADCNNKDCE